MSDLFGNSKERRWYIVQAYSGYENKVKENLLHWIGTTDVTMADKIFRVLIPTEEHEIKKDGKTRKVKRKVFPTYVLVDMILDERSWYVVRHTPGVTGFVGSGNHPIPLTQKEADEILNKHVPQNAEEASKPKIEVDIVPGDMVVVKEGAGSFAGRSGEVTEVNAEKAKIKFRTMIFGRETEVEADYTDLAKI